ncbi:MAG TPA: SRPBCC family protein [Kofleriaceae bacterium]|nr:SRPBCC family protein [Kofleriaceae bacterium]
MPGTSALVRAAATSMPPITTEVAVTLPVSAADAFEIFADAGETPRWLRVVQSAQVIDRHEDGRPRTVSFRAAFDRATLGYVVRYRYRPEALTLTWATRGGSAIRVEGEARFVGLTPRACLMTYRLGLELPVSPEWLETHYDGHAASAIVGDFREHLRRFA